MHSGPITAKWRWSIYKNIWRWDDQGALTRTTEGTSAENRKKEEKKNTHQMTGVRKKENTWENINRCLGRWVRETNISEEEAIGLTAVNKERVGRSEGGTTGCGKMLCTGVLTWHDLAYETATSSPFDHTDGWGTCLYLMWVCVCVFQTWKTAWNKVMIPIFPPFMGWD